MGEKSRGWDGVAGAEVLRSPGLGDQSSRGFEYSAPATPDSGQRGVIIAPMPTVTVHDAIDLAIAHQRAGRLDEAEAIYRQILAAVPDQPDTMHLLGTVAYTRGDLPATVELISKAIA